VKELIEVRNAEINARDDDGRTALRIARNRNKAEIAAYLVTHGAVEYDDDGEEEAEEEEEGNENEEGRPRRLDRNEDDDN
jgi:ankyrin repeat protein